MNKQVETIRAEIERREKIIRNSANQISDSEKKTYYSGGADALLELLPFITSLQQEQPVEGLEEKDFVEEVRQYYTNNCTWDALKQPMLSIITRCARHFAEWGIEEGRLLALENMRA